MPEQTTLRDALSGAFDSVLPETPAAPAVETTPAETKADAPAKTETPDRARDEQGRFVEGKQEKPAAKPQGQPAAAPAPAQTVSAPKYPSTWKKGLEAQYSSLPPEIIAEITRRESDYAKGVSTYKHEWDTAKPLIDAMAPFMPLLEQHKIPPAQWISRLGDAHRQLSLGTPEQKAQMFARLAQDYGVPLQGLIVQGQDGKLYINPSLMQQQANAQQQSPQLRQEDITKIVEQKLLEQSNEAAIAAFAAQKDKYPHFEEVRDTMAGLLQAGLADGLEDAYNEAMKHSRHAELYKEVQEQQRQQEEARQAEERRKATEAARRKAVSPRTNTPTSVVNAGEGRKGLRATIESAADEILANRV